MKLNHNIVPTTLNLPAIKQGLIQKTDEQLVDILSFSQDHYDERVIPVINEILKDRGHTDEQLQSYNDNYSKKVDTVKISTLFIKATFDTRVAAFIVDLVIIDLASWSTGYMSHPTGNHWGYGIAFLIFFFYFFITEGLLSQTAGMAIFKIKIITESDLKDIGFSISFARTIGRIICWLTIGLGYISMLFNKENQALHDIYAKTIVVKVND